MQFRGVLNNQEDSGILSFCGVSSILICVVASIVRLLIASKGMLFWTILLSVPLVTIGFLMNGKIHLVKVQKLILIQLTCALISASMFSGLTLDSIKVQLVAILLFLYLVSSNEMKFICGFLFVEAAFFIWCYFFSYEYYGGGVRRYIFLQNSIYLDPNMVAASFIVPSLIATDVCVSSKYNLFKKILAIVFLALVFFVNILSGSRTAIIISVLGISIISIRKNLRGRKKIIIMLLFAALIASIFSYDNILPQDLLNRFKVSDVVETGGNGRIDLYKETFEYLKYDPNVFKLFFGYGVNSSVFYLGKSIHNTALDFLWELGIFGFLLYLFVTCYAAKVCIKSKSDMAIACFVCTVTWSMTLSACNQLIYWVLIYISICFAYNKQK